MLNPHAPQPRTTGPLWRKIESDALEAQRRLLAEMEAMEARREAERRRMEAWRRERDEARARLAAEKKALADVLAKYRCVVDIIASPKDRIAAIIEGVAKRHRFTVQDLIGKCNRQSVAAARQEAMASVALQTPLSLPAIGKHFGGRNHTTILHAICCEAVRLNKTIRGWTPEEAAERVERMRRKACARVARQKAAR